MKLIVDIGNTKVKAGVFDGKTLVETRAYDEFQLCDFQKIKKDYPIERTLVCAVGNCPDWITAGNAGLFVWRGGESVAAGPSGHTATSAVRYPLNIRQYDATTLGLDRIAIGVALRYLYPGQAVLGIALGSCITYNLIRPDGCLEPGPISPGVCMRGRAMHAFTHALPSVVPDWRAATWSEPMPVADTETALRAGMVDGVRYELEGFVARYRAAYGNLPVVLTGGDAAYFEFSPKKRIFASPNLGLIGLNEILDYNNR